jgi:hypothetical protein
MRLSARIADATARALLRLAYAIQRSRLPLPRCLDERIARDEAQMAAYRAEQADYEAFVLQARADHAWAVANQLYSYLNSPAADALPPDQWLDAERQASAAWSRALAADDAADFAKFLDDLDHDLQGAEADRVRSDIEVAWLDDIDPAGCVADEDSAAVLFGWADDQPHAREGARGGTSS